MYKNALTYSAIEYVKQYNYFEEKIWHILIKLKIYILRCTTVIPFLCIQPK